VVISSTAANFFLESDLQPFTLVRGIAAPLPAANIDTDVIMPKKFLKGVDRTGLKSGVFHDLRFDGEGRTDETFILNRHGWTGASILVVGPNFGCGSSREHAVWGLVQLGIRALIGTTFAGIFFDNCARNGLLAITLEPERVAEISALAGEPAHNTLSIDLPAQTITSADRQFRFDIGARLKETLVEGLDTVGVTLRDRDAIRVFERGYLAGRPWLATPKEPNAPKRTG
jgi:3-isopropylmalate/(R)-2-methylmalate dehydratase small subunit